jgi:hypothetical protein
MAVAFDAKPTGTSPNFDAVFSGATSVNLGTLTVGSGSNRALVASIMFNAVVSTVALHWDTAGTNQSMTQIGTGTNSIGSTNVIYLFGLLAPTSGAKTLGATWTTSAAGYLSGISWTGVSQTSFATSFINFNHVANSCGGTTTSSITVTTTSGNATVEFGGNSGSETGTAFNQTQWYEDHTGTPNSWANYALSAGASTTFNETVSATSTQTHECGCDIVAAATGDVLQAQIVM